VRFTLHSPGTVGAIKIDWDAPVERCAAMREAMRPHELDTMRAGILTRGFAVGRITYPRGTIALRVAEGHELFLQHPHEAVAAAPREVIAAAWTVEHDGPVARHRVTVGSAGADERADVVLTARVPGLSRARAQRLISDGRASVAGQVIRSNHRLRATDVIELVIDEPPIAG